MDGLGFAEAHFCHLPLRKARQLGGSHHRLLAAPVRQVSWLGHLPRPSGLPILVTRTVALKRSSRPPLQLRGSAGFAPASLFSAAEPPWLGRGNLTAMSARALGRRAAGRQGAAAFRLLTLLVIPDKKPRVDARQYP